MNKSLSTLVSRSVTIITRTFSYKPKMPLSNQTLKLMQAQQAKKRAKQANRVLGKVSFQILGNGVPGCPKSLFVFTDRNRYLFNCGEGTQKICQGLSGNRSLSQLTDIFVTRKTWDNIGGLPGLCLSIRSAGAPDVRLHGPNGIVKMYDAMKHFVKMHDFQVNYQGRDDGLFQDGTIYFNSVELRSTRPNYVAPQPKYSKLVNDMNIAYDETNLEKIEIEDVVYAYIMKVDGKAGKVDMKKCVELGVKPGPLIGMLKQGHVIKLDNDKVVRPEDVLIPSEGAATYLIIDCPDETFLPSLMEDSSLRFDHSLLKDLCGIFHFAPVDVVKTEVYSNWMNSFSENVHHVMINEKSFDYAMKSSDVVNATLNMIAPSIFPKALPGEKIELDYDPYEKIKGKIVQGKTDLSIDVLPVRNKITDEEYDTAAELQANLDLLDPKEVEDVLEVTKKSIEKELTASASNSEYPKVTFLGTGSAIPSKYRNVSSILVETEADNYIMFDCGEGTLLQIFRTFGLQKSKHILRNLKAVLVSHLHSDHHLGLINIILHRDKYVESASKLYVVAPARIVNYLSVYHQHFQPILTNLYHIRNEHLLPPTLYNEGPNGSGLQVLNNEERDQLLQHTRAKFLKTCRVLHCPSAFAFALKNSEGYKILYSGDTMPCDSVLALGKDEGLTDLLIHEATMSHSMLDDCKFKKHTTFLQSVDIAKEMKAKNAIMTHFSQRYSKMMSLDEFEGEDTDNIGVAFDFMTVNPRTINVLRKAFPAMKVLFEEDINETMKKNGDPIRHYALEYLIEDESAEMDEKDQAKKRGLEEDKDEQSTKAKKSFGDFSKNYEASDDRKKSFQAYADNIKKKL